MSAPTAAQLKMTGKRSSAAPATGGGSGSGSVVRKRTHDMHNDSIEHIVLVYTATWTAESVKEEFSKMDKESMEASIQLCKEMSEKLNGDEVAVSHKILTIFKELWHSCTDIMKKNGIPPRLSHDAVVLMKMIMAITVKCNNTKEVKKARTKPPASPEASAPASPQASARGPVDKQQQQQQQQRPSDADGTKRKKLQAAASPANNMPLPAAAKEKPANKLKIFAKPNKEHEENKPNKEHDKEHEEQANDPLPSGTSCFKDDKEASKDDKQASESGAGGDLSAGVLGFFGTEAEDNDLTEVQESE